MFGFWILLLLAAVLILATPWWSYSRQWGYWPGGAALGLLLVWLFLTWFGLVVFAWPWATVAPP